MIIEKLPDDCLLYIFNLLNNFETLMNCASVCKRWKDLVFERLNSVNYLTDTWQSRNGYPASYTVFFKGDDRLKLARILKLLPRLKILELCGRHDLDCISNLEVKGLQFNSYRGQLDNCTLDISSVEMIASHHFHNFFANDTQGPKLTQLFISYCDVSKFASCAQYFPNLKRLHIELLSAPLPFSDSLYSGPVLEKLEILEISLFDNVGEIFAGAFVADKTYYGFSLADHCPALKSAFHAIRSGEPFVNSEIKNYVLEDLVLRCGGFYHFDWPILRRILSKYPNLKHLAIGGGTYTGISDENIPELLELLPRITLIDIRDSANVTEKSADYIDWYCEHHNRSISLYRRNNRAEITKKWPHLSFVSIGREFDFMKYCFFCDYNELPFLLDFDE